MGSYYLKLREKIKLLLARNNIGSEELEKFVSENFSHYDSIFDRISKSREDENLKIENEPNTPSSNSYE